ncbi:hypothetical protein B0H13DRAFT_1856798 [Mycena leptocephala]|nr:hypothetical protein B0H13DRAFT_1856798 [Mycena leptocephala]
MVFNFVRTLLYQRLGLFGVRLEFKLRLLWTVNELVKGELVVNKYIIMCAVFESPISGDWIGLVIVFGTTKPEMDQLEIWELPSRRLLSQRRRSLILTAQRSAAHDSDSDFLGSMLQFVQIDPACATSGTVGVGLRSALHPTSVICFRSPCAALMFLFGPGLEIFLSSQSVYVVYEGWIRITSATAPGQGITFHIMTKAYTWMVLLSPVFMIGFEEQRMVQAQATQKSAGQS